MISAINNMAADDLATLWAKESAAPLFTSFYIDHYIDVIMGAMTSQITSLTTVFSAVDSGADQRKYQSSASLYLSDIHREPVHFQHKGPVTRKIFPFDDIINFQPRTVI